MITFCTTVPKCTAFPPTAIQVASISPPNSACDELDGRPRNQVSRFHTIAPTNAPNTMYGPVVAWNLASSTMPPEMVVATFTERNAPSTFSAPEMVTATFGFSAPVSGLGLLLGRGESRQPGQTEGKPDGWAHTTTVR